MVRCYPSTKLSELVVHSLSSFAVQPAADSASSSGFCRRWGVAFLQFRFLRNAEPPQGAFEFDDRVAEGAERGFHVAEEFVDALGVLASGHSGVAAGDAFDEVHERLFDLARVVDCRRTFGTGKVAFEELQKAPAFGYQDVGFGAERTAQNRLCRRREIFQQTVRVVRLAVEDAADALFARRHFGLSPVCREDFHEQSVEPRVAFDYRLDGFRKSRFFVFLSHSLILSLYAGPEGKKRVCTNRAAMC